MEKTKKKRSNFRLHVVKDKHGRDVEITHFDNDGKVTYALVYTYSK